MLFIIIISALIIFTIGILFGIGLAQVASKEMPRPPKQIHKVNQVSDEMMRQAFQDADDREMWG